MARAQNQPRVNAVKRARGAAAAVEKGAFKQKSRKIRTKTTFFRPKTLRKARQPAYLKKGVSARDDKFDDFRVIKHPLSSESAVKIMEEENTLSFLVDTRANKIQIAKAVSNLYDCKVQRVNTLIRPDGQKKAFVRLAASEEAMAKAGKIGIF